LITALLDDDREHGWRETKKKPVEWTGLGLLVGAERREGLKTLPYDYGLVDWDCSWAIFAAAAAAAYWP
jgi:hypothetical protein